MSSLPVCNVNALSTTPCPTEKYSETLCDYMCVVPVIHSLDVGSKEGHQQGHSHRWIILLLLLLLQNIQASVQLLGSSWRQLLVWILPREPCGCQCCHV